MRPRPLLAAWGPPAAWAALLFLGSSASFRTGRILFPGADKVVHLLEYGVLGFLVARAILRTCPAWPLARTAVVAAVAAAAYGGVDEFHQSGIPGREADWADGAADAAGGLAGAGLFAALAARRSAVSARPGGP